MTDPILPTSALPPTTLGADSSPEGVMPSGASSPDAVPCPSCGCSASAFDMTPGYWQVLCEGDAEACSYCAPMRETRDAAIAAHNAIAAAVASHAALTARVAQLEAQVGQLREALGGLERFVGRLRYGQTYAGRPHAIMDAALAALAATAPQEGNGNA